MLKIWKTLTNREDPDKMPRKAAISSDSALFAMKKQSSGTSSGTEISFYRNFDRQPPPCPVNTKQTIPYIVWDTPSEFKRLRWAVKNCIMRWSQYCMYSK